MKPDKKVLIITYYWPPASGPGVQRWLKFVKYLDRFGWQPIVLTVKDGSYPNTDKSLEEDVPSSIQIHKTKTLEPFKIYNWLRGKKSSSIEVGMGNIAGSQSTLNKIANYIRANYFIPDARKGWNRYAVRKAKSILEKSKVDVIITTGPPHSSHLIGLLLKNDFDLPWVADFRDPWTSIYYNKYLNRTNESNKEDKHLETKVVQKADHLLVVGNHMKAEFEDRAQKVTVLSNGYDPDDIKIGENEKNNMFLFSYVGNLKSNQDIEGLWKAFVKLKKRFPAFLKHFQFRIIGNSAKNIEESIRKWDLKENVKKLPFVPHREAVQWMIKSDLLYLPVPRVEHAEYLITGKIFEYLASTTPILSIGPTKGDASDILIRSKRAEMLDYEDEDGIYKRLEIYFSQWLKTGQIDKEQSDTHIQFSRIELTRKLSQLLNDMTHNDI